MVFFSHFLRHFSHISGVAIIGGVLTRSLTIFKLSVMISAYFNASLALFLKNLRKFFRKVLGNSKATTASVKTLSFLLDLKVSYSYKPNFKPKNNAFKFSKSALSLLMRATSIDPTLTLLKASFLRVRTAKHSALS